MNLAHLLIIAIWFDLSYFSPPDKSPILLADPTIFYHDGSYYLYGTSGQDSNRGFEVYVSKDLKS